MNYRQVLLAITLASGLGACASSPDYGLRYQDGSYYSPAAEGLGDYYVGVEPQRPYYLYDDFDVFFGSGYGWYDSPFYSRDGYCSVRYRYCPRWAWGDGFGAPYGQAGFQLYFGSPWDPYGSRGYYPSRPYRDTRRRPPSSTQNDSPQWPAWPGDAHLGVQRPQPRPEPRIEQDQDDSPLQRGRGARTPFPRTSERVLSPRSRPKPQDDDGN